MDYISLGLPITNFKEALICEYENFNVDEIKPSNTRNILDIKF